MGDIADRYRRRADAFDRTVAAVGPEDWSSPSPCAAWTASGVVDHVVAMHEHMVRSAGRVPAAAPPVHEDPLAAFRAARAGVEAVLADQALSATECQTPAGPMTVERQIDEVVSDDLPVHRWDLAKATGLDDTIDPQDVERLWASTAAIPPDLMGKYRTPGAFGPGIEVFGPEVHVPDGAPLQHRLLGLVGRNPDWRPPGP